MNILHVKSITYSHPVCQFLANSAVLGLLYHHCYSSLDVLNNSDGKASLKRQKSPESTTVTQDLSKFYRFNV